MTWQKMSRLFIFFHYASTHKPLSFARDLQAVVVVQFEHRGGVVQ